MWPKVKHTVSSIRPPGHDGETILGKMSSAKENATDLMNETKKTLSDVVKKTIRQKANPQYETWEDKCIKLVHDCFTDPAVLTDAIKESDFLKMDKTASNIQTQLERSKENINRDTPNTEGDLYYRKDPERLDKELSSCGIDPTSLKGYDKIRYAATIMHAITTSGYMSLYTDNTEQVTEAKNFEQSLRSNVLPLLMNIKITADQINQLPIPEVFKQKTKKLLRRSSGITTKAALLSEETTELYNQLEILLRVINNENRKQVSQTLDSVMNQIIENERFSVRGQTSYADLLEWTTDKTDDSRTPEQGNSPDQLVPLYNTTDNEQNRHPDFEMTVIPEKAGNYPQDGSEITTGVDPRLRGDDILGTDNSDETIDIALDNLRQHYSLNKVEEETYLRHQLATAGILLITASASLALISLTCGMPLILCGLAIGATLIKAAIGVSMGVGIAGVFSSLLPDRFFKPNDFFDTDDKNKTPTEKKNTKYTHYEYCIATGQYTPIIIPEKEVPSDDRFSV